MNHKTKFVQVIISLVLSIGIISVGLFALLTFQGILLSTQRQSTATFQIIQISYMVSQSLTLRNTWNNTISDSANTTLSCLQTHMDCFGVTGPVRLKDSSGALFLGYDPLIATNGFTLNGQICNSFTVSGNNACPFRLDFTYTSTCSVSPCIDPQGMLVGIWTYSPTSSSNRIVFNPTNYISRTIVGGLTGVPVGGCQIYQNSGYLGTVTVTGLPPFTMAIGFRNCWGQVQDLGTTANCRNSSIPVITGIAEDQIGAGGPGFEFATNGIDLFVACGNAVPAWCNIFYFVCLR